MAQPDKPEKTGTLSAEKLCELSGLTDRRHRQIAAEGFFPPPIKGQYQANSTIRGLLRYYREMTQRSGSGIKQKREAKLDKEVELMDMDIAERKGHLISVDDMEQRLRPMLIAVRQKVLGSTMTDDEKDELLTDLGVLLENALIRSQHAHAPPAASDLDQAAAVHG